jgi:hypothetical protein
MRAVEYVYPSLSIQNLETAYLNVC